MFGLISNIFLVRYVGGGNKGIRSSDRMSSRMSSVSVDDLRNDDLETRSIAASHTSHLSSSRLGSSHYNSKRNMLANISRESSKVMIMISSEILQSIQISKN